MRREGATSSARPPPGAPCRRILPWLDPRDLPTGSAVDREDTPGPETMDPGQGAADLGFIGAVPSGKKPMEPPAGEMTLRATKQEGASGESEELGEERATGIL